MGVFFANDVDTVSANPQEVIRTLPPDARFAIAGKRDEFWLANPETPAGYDYYRTQVAALLAAYPQITNLVVWFRGGRTPWMDLQVTDMPPGWQEEIIRRGRSPSRPQPRNSGTPRTCLPSARSYAPTNGR